MAIVRRLWFNVERLSPATVESSGMQGEALSRSRTQRHSHPSPSATAQILDAFPSCIPTTMTMQSAGWLSISTEGFAAMNAARPAEHLIKELVQNAFDSFVEGQPGRIELRYSSQTEGLVVECADNGSGISNLGDLRVVYLTHKTDSHLKRGRFGGVQGGALHRRTGPGDQRRPAAGVSAGERRAGDPPGSSQ
jgi:hypothetical protein